LLSISDTSCSSLAVATEDVLRNSLRPPFPDFSKYSCFLTVLKELLRFMNSWVKADGSFSEAGEVWPWSCSVDLCYKIYSEQSIEILRGLGYTTLGTTASTLYGNFRY
jgi:hypothetical protein